MIELKEKLISDIKVRLTLVKPNQETMARSIPWLTIESEIRDCYLRKVPAAVEHNGELLGYCCNDKKRGWLWWVEQNDILREKLESSII